jgi:hypothetical protein
MHDKNINDPNAHLLVNEKKAEKHINACLLKQQIENACVTII